MREFNIMTIPQHQSVETAGRPTISACLIVKNEEKFLPQCLESIKNAVDEIIVVDTGSTDRTVEIATSFGARVYHHPWRNSFSEARNHSISYATCDWILQIDADESLEQADIPLLHSLIHTSLHNAILVAIYSELPGGLSKHYFTRIFRRGKGRFEGIVHNQLVFEGCALQSEIRIQHYGYNLPGAEMQKKYKRTGDLLRQQLAEDPNNAFALANLIRNYRNEGNYDKVIELCEMGLQNLASQKDVTAINHKQRIYIDLIYARINQKQLNKAAEICKDAINESPDSLDILFAMGEISLKKEAYEDSLNAFKKYLVIKEKESKNPAFNLYIVDSYTYEHKAYNNIGICYDRLGCFTEAEQAYKKSLQLSNTEPVYYLNLMSLYASQNRFGEAEQVAIEAINKGIASNEVYLRLGNIQVAAGKSHVAIDTFKRLIQMGDNDINTYLLLINLLIQTNQLKDAEETLNGIITSYPDHVRLGCLTGRINYKKGDKDSVINFIEGTLRSNPSNSAVFHDLGNLCIEIEEYNKAIELLGRYLAAFPTDAMTVANIATCYAKLGKFDAAIVGLEAALKLDPRCGYAIQNLAILKKKLQR